jgi:Na+-driven multidrug efflux pump
MSNMLTQTMGNALQASIIATTRQGLFLIPNLFVLSSFLDLLGVQLSTPVADLMSLIIVVPIMVRVLKSLSVPDRGTLSD